MNIYVDFDGVIVDTITHLLDSFEEQIKAGIVKDDMEYVLNIDWDDYLKKSPVIEGSFEYLRINPDAIVLTKVCSEHEAIAKTNFLRNNNLFNQLIAVPINCQKSDIVDAYNSILIDDTVHNLDSWFSKGGICYYFNFNGNSKDPWNDINTKYDMITNLEQLKQRVRK